jgi:ABC-2 type transport system permease protein
MSTAIVTRRGLHPPAHRIMALARAEAVLLRRNRTVLLTAVVLPAPMVYGFKMLPGAAGLGGFGAAFLIELTAFALLFAVYYNLVTTLVARRDQLVLKRLRTGESSDGEILAGTAAPAVAIAWAQIAVAGVATVAVSGLARPANAVLALVALAGGSVVFVLLAVVSAAVTRSVEMAQITTLPVLIIPFAFSGLVFRLALLPEPLRWAADALPLTPVAELMRLALTGTTADGHHLGLTANFAAAAVPVLVLAAWAVAGGWAARRWFRWEPRR